MATVGAAKAGIVDKIDSLRAATATTAKDMIYLAKALKENETHNNFTFIGAWANSTAYATDEVVTTGGKTYICILGYTSAASPGAFAVGSNWSLMAEKGTDGTDGASGIPSGGTVGQVVTNTGAGAGGWADAAGGIDTSGTPTANQFAAFTDVDTVAGRAIVGTVSQSSGTATGAIFEKGSNSNGNYVKYADGTLVCTIEQITSNSQANVVWTYPATFSNKNSAVSGVNGYTGGDHSRIVVMGSQNRTTTTFPMFVYNIESGTGRSSNVMSLISIGRWY